MLITVNEIFKPLSDQTYEIKKSESLNILYNAIASHSLPMYYFEDIPENVNIERIHTNKEMCENMAIFTFSKTGTYYIIVTSRSIFQEVSRTIEVIVKDDII